MTGRSSLGTLAAVFVLVAACATGRMGSPARQPVKGATLEAGVGIADITPPIGIEMAGHFRRRVNSGVHDPLKIKALVLKQGHERMALVICDLVSVPQEVAVRMRRQIASRTGISYERVSVSATHTHTGPLFHGEPARPTDVEYVELLVRRGGEAAAEAARSLAPATLDAGKTIESSLSFNRRYFLKDGTLRTNPGPGNPDVVRPAGPIDPDVGILFLRRAGRPFAALVTFALHLDTWPRPVKEKFSADYPYFLEAELKRAYGPSFVSLFAIAPCGDINHVDVIGDRRLETRAIGTRLGADVVAAAAGLQPVRPALAARHRSVPILLKKVPAEELAWAQAAAHKLGQPGVPTAEQAAIRTALTLQKLPPELTFDVQAFRLGRNTALVTLPGEIFVELGMAIKKASPFENTFVIELANANPAYIPTRRAYTEGGYEVANSKLAPGGGERLTEVAVDLLRDLAR